METGWMEGASPGKARVRVLVVDDQVSVRGMVAMLLDRDRHSGVTAEASSGLEGLRQFRRYVPDMLIAGLALPEMSGPEMIRVIRAEAPAVRVLVYSGSRNEDLIRAGLACRPHGFIHKTESLEALRQACAAVAGGMSFFGPFATGVMDAQGRAGAGGGSLLPGLTPRERHVLQLVAEGLSTKQVAGRLFLAPKTVEHYRRQLIQKLGLRDVASLTRYAVRCGLVEG